MSLLPRCRQLLAAWAIAFPPAAPLQAAPLQAAPMQAAPGQAAPGQVAPGQAAPVPGTVTHLANDGFLVEAGGRKVLVDALFQMPKYYPAFTPELAARMTRGEPPFDRIDLVLVTHVHEDHVDPALAAAFLKRHPEATLLAHPQVLEQLGKQDLPPDVRARIRAVGSAPGRPEHLELPGIKVDLVTVHHVGGTRFTWDVLFAVDQGGFRWIHTGDARFDENQDRLRDFPFRAVQPDVLFLQFFDRSEETRAFLRRRLQPGRIVAMHVAPERLAETTKEVLAELPEAIVFEKPLDSLRFEGGRPPWKPEGDYLDQPLPGARPVVFARGIVSTDNMEHSAPSFSPDGSEVFWSIWRKPMVQEDRQVIMTARRVEGAWSTAEVAPFSGRFDDGQPAFSPDGKRLVFMSKRPMPGGSTPRENDLWMIERGEGGWSEPACLGLLARYPSLGFVAQPSLAANGNLYFIGDAGKDRFAIFRCLWVGGHYGPPERLPASINLPDTVNWTPFIAPDESYLLFSSSRRAPAQDVGDLWISRRKADGTWGEPTLLPEAINSNRQDRFPAVSPDGKVLFYTRPTPGRYHDIYWVSTAAIDALKPARPGDGKEHP